MHIIVRFWELFTLALADSLALEFEWQQNSSSLQDSSQYSCRSQQYCRLDGYHSSSYFRVLQSLYQSFRDCTKSTNYNCYNRHFHVPQFFQSPGKVPVHMLLFTSFQFFIVVSLTAKSTILQVFFFFFVLIIIRSGHVSEISWSVSHQR